MASVRRWGSMMGKSQRDKGARWEREVARMLREAGIEARRGLGQARSASEVADVAVEGWWIECKVGGPAAYPLRALEQAYRAVREAASMSEPVAICKPDRREPTATFLWRMGRDPVDAPLMAVTVALEDWIRMVAHERQGGE